MHTEHTPLPSMRTLHELAELGGPFPIQCRHLILAAERYGFPGKVITFLQSFPAHAVFRSREAFLQECEATCASTPHHQPKEGLLALFAHVRRAYPTV